MKQGSLKVGTRDGVSVTVPFNEPENIEEVQRLARSDPKVIVRCFSRGWRIENQERSGARDVVREAKRNNGESNEDFETRLTREVATKVHEYDPTKVTERATGGRPRKAKRVTVSREDTAGVSESLLEKLKAAGIQIEVGE